MKIRGSVSMVETSRISNTSARASEAHHCSVFPKAGRMPQNGELCAMDSWSAFWNWYFAHADKLAPAATVIGAVATILVGVVAAWIALARHRAQTNADIQRRIIESF